MHSAAPHWTGKGTRGQGAEGIDSCAGHIETQDFTWGPSIRAVGYVSPELREMATFLDADISESFNAQMILKIKWLKDLAKKREREAGSQALDPLSRDWSERRGHSKGRRAGGPGANRTGGTVPWELREGTRTVMPMRTEKWLNSGRRVRESTTPCTWFPWRCRTMSGLFLHFQDSKPCREMDNHGIKPHVPDPVGVVSEGKLRSHSLWQLTATWVWARLGKPSQNLTGLISRAACLWRKSRDTRTQTREVQYRRPWAMQWWRRGNGACGRAAGGARPFATREDADGDSTPPRPVICGSVSALTAPESVWLSPHWGDLTEDSCALTFSPLDDPQDAPGPLWVVLRGWLQAEDRRGAQGQAQR